MKPSAFIEVKQRLPTDKTITFLPEDPGKVFFGLSAELTQCSFLIRDYFFGLFREVVEKFLSPLP